uniref:Uncharacterized protein n=1 Tax=viral metagenome TaxID=1070528 RepID=A0A6C0BC27_9ZZZZ
MASEDIFLAYATDGKITSSGLKNLWKTMIKEKSLEGAKWDNITEEELQKMINDVSPDDPTGIDPYHFNSTINEENPISWKWKQLADYIREMDENQKVSSPILVFGGPGKKYRSKKTRKSRKSRKTKTRKSRRKRRSKK